MARPPGEPRRPKPSASHLSQPQTETPSSMELPPPQTSPLPPVPTPLPVLPLILQPAVIVWARIHLQEELHGEPCPARGLRGPRTALSCPEGLGGQGSGQGWGHRPGPAFPHAARCRSLESSLKIHGLGEEAAAADPGPSPALPGPALSCRQLPPPVRPVPAARCRCRLPGGIRLLQSMLPAPPALPMPLSGAGVAPLPGPGL